LLLALVLNGLVVSPLILHLLGARLSGTGLVEFPPLSVRRAASAVAVARTALNRRRDRPPLILAVVMIVLAALRLGRCGDEKERRRRPEHLGVLHRSSIRSMYCINQYPPARDVCRFRPQTRRGKTTGS